VVDFLTAAPGVVVVDSTDLDFDQTVDAVLAVIRTVDSAAGETPSASPRGTTTHTRTGA
jgi:hypothetical protein